MAHLRPLLTYTAVLAVVFLLAVGIGYVYTHEPERDLVEVVVDRAAAEGAGGRVTSGTISGLEGDTLRLDGAEGTIEVSIAGAAVEELRRLDGGAARDAGVAVNLGGERTATERVITGVVVFAPEVTP
ncbi:MAG: hypothetical protein O3A76_16480 [Chloroflexi bacterium]|nr:hypothetical protein [Chloroflexota bacterium]